MNILAVDRFALLPPELHTWVLDQLEDRLYISFLIFIIEHPPVMVRQRGFKTAE